MALWVPQGKWTFSTTAFSQAPDWGPEVISEEEADGLSGIILVLDW